jgi:ATP-dependent Clp protease ATP-binding subunit ClpC
VFERFSERARQVVVLAQDEARALKHNYIGTEHILLGLLREEEGLASRVLESFDITVEEVRVQVALIIGEGDEVTTGQIPFTPRAKKVLELALREALKLGHNYIGTEHILLGLVRVDEGVAARILLDFGADAEKIRNEIIRRLSGPGRRQQEPDVPPGPFVVESPPLSPEVGEEIDRVRQEKEEALEKQEFERAAMLRARERRLVDAARQLARAWKEEPNPPPPPVAEATGVVRAVRVPGSGRRHARREQQRRTWQAEALVAGWAMFGAAAAVGLLLGWLIWG